MTFRSRLNKTKAPKKEKKANQKAVPEAEAANPSLEKMTAVAQVIGLKSMPMGKMLCGVILSTSRPQTSKIKKGDTC